jgi:hypothetical protein
MPLDLQEERARNVPLGSILKVKVVTRSTNVNATGRVDFSQGTDLAWPHGKIVNRTASAELLASGRQFARVTIIVSATTEQEATVEFSIEDPAGAVIRSWQPTFAGKMVGADIYVGNAKWIVSVVGS